MILSAINTVMGPEAALKRMGKGSFEKKQREAGKQLVANLIQEKNF